MSRYKMLNIRCLHGDCGRTIKFTASNSSIEALITGPHVFMSRADSRRLFTFVDRFLAGNKTGQSSIAKIRNLNKKLKIARESLYGIMPDNHYGCDVIDMECNNACVRSLNDAWCTKHRPDIGDDRCDKEDDCVRCCVLNTLDAINNT